MLLYFLKAISFLLSLLACLSSTYFVYLVVKHLRGKSLGMQTFHDKCLIEALVCFLALSWCWTLTIVFGVSFPGAFNETQIRIICVTIIACALSWHFSTIFFLFVKYMTIYHNLDDFIHYEEGKLIVLQRLVIWILSLTIAYFDVGLRQDLSQFAAFSMLRLGSMLYNGSMFDIYGTVAPFTSSFMVVVGMALHMKIEAENKTMSLGQIRYDDDQEMPIKLASLRVISLTFGTIAILMYVVAPYLSYQEEINFIVASVIVSLLFGISPPMFALSHKKIRQTFFGKFAMDSVG